MSALTQRVRGPGRRQVAITGIGVVAPNGIGRQAFWESLIAGESGVGSVSEFDTAPYACKVAGSVKNFRPSDFMAGRTSRRISRCTQLAVAAARLALEDAAIHDAGPSLGRRIGVCFGTSASGIGDIGEENHRRFLTRADGLNPLAMLEYPAHATTSHIARELSVSGPSTTISSGCATGLDAIVWGINEIAHGNLDVALVGAADAPITEFIFSLFSAGGFLASWPHEPTRASRPYDQLRSGLVLAEAGGALILEAIDHAMDRSQVPYALVRGTGNASEGGFAGGISRVYQEALQTAIRQALRSAELSPFEIDHINSHGNSTKTDDAAETAAYKNIFGGYAYNIPVTSIKGATGQPLAAGGVLQLAAVALSIRNGIVPPTINQELPDPDCDLDYVPNRARVVRIHFALTHSHSLGGLLPGSHTALIASHVGI